MVRRITREHIKVAMKVWLNNGQKTNKQLISSNEQKEFEQLVESGYITIVDKNYAEVTPGFQSIMEHMLIVLETSMESGRIMQMNYQNSGK